MRVGGPEPERTITGREGRCAHPPALAASEEVGPGFRRFAVPIGQGDEHLAAVRFHADHVQQAHLVLGQPDFHVDPFSPDVDEITVGEGPLVEYLGLTLPLGRQPGDRWRQQPGPGAQELLQRRGEIQGLLNTLCEVPVTDPLGVPL